MQVFLPVLVALCVLAADRLEAHEFWIDVVPGRAEVGEAVSVDLKVGQQMRGVSWPYLSDRFTDFFWIAGRTGWAAEGREGDLPALTITPDRPGLHLIVHRTVPFLLTYEDWETFTTTLDEEGYQELAAQHRDRGLPATGFTERYVRVAKALFQVGPARAEETDIAIGLPYEAVAESNPFLPGARSVEVRFLLDGAPLEGRQVTLFRDDGEVTRTTFETDAAGRVTLPIEPGAAYLVSSVVMAPIEDGDVVWQSHWASLSFRLP